MNNNDVIEIKDTRIDVGQITDQIKREISKKKVEYLQLIGKDIPSTVDVVENSEYLLDGWYESEVDGDQRIRWTKKEFSMLFNPGSLGKVVLKVVFVPPQVSRCSLKISLYVDDQIVGTESIRKGGDLIVFDLFKYKNSNIELVFKLSYDFCPAELTHGGDTRHLGIAISQITNEILSDIGSKFVPELVKIETDLSLLLEKVRLHTNPESFIPRKTRGKFVKNFVLRLMRPFTAVQLTFNYYVAEALKVLGEHIKVVSEYLAKTDQKVLALQNSLEVESNRQYRSLYWKENEDKFYQFHQNSFRGSAEEVKKKLMFYLDYLDRPDFYKKFPFVDFGCGRGEFLELLRDRDIRSFGVDVNECFVSLGVKNKLDIHNQDAINFLSTTKDNLGGVSAFHLVEHFTFPQLFDFVYLIREKLVDGGVMILETPNPDNLVVAAEHFYNDFTHVTKLPPILLLKLCEYVGFKKDNVKILPINPERDGDLTGVDYRVYGPMDYALIAVK